VDVTVLTLLTIGLFAGAIGAALGVGGGIVIVPALVVLVAVPQHAAQGTSLAVIIPTAIVAAAVHGRAGRVDWRLAVALGSGGVVGGLLGAVSALSLDALVLRRLFAVFLVVMAVRMLRTAVTKAPQQTGGAPPG
jgi:uncharacterized protein